MAVGALVAYHQSFTAPFVFDDIPSIRDNLSLQEPWSLGAILQPIVDGGATVSGRPLVNLSFALNKMVGDKAVWGFHASNFLIHLLAGLILFGVVRRTLIENVGRGHRTPPVATERGDKAVPPYKSDTDALAFFVVAIWLLHPMQTGAVTYIVQRAESLTGLWYLLTLYGFIRGTAGAGFRWLAVSVVACLLGMATKEVMVSAPLIVLLYDRTFVAGTFREAWSRRRLYYLGLASTWLLLAFLLAGTENRGGTAGFSTGVSPWEYATTQCQAIVHYLRLVIWPEPLIFDYGTSTVGGLSEVWLQALLLLGLVGGTVWALWRRPVWGFVGTCFFAILAPSSSVVPVATQTMAEHRMYLPLVIPVVLIVLGLHRLAGRWSYAVCGFLALICGGLTNARNADYATDYTLWADTVEKRPGNPRAHHNLGLAELARGNLAEAERHVGDAIALVPKSPEPHYSLGLILTRLGRLSEAIDSYQQAITYEPRHAAAHNNMANLLFTAGRINEAGQHYAEAVRLQPDFAAARNSYGNWLLEHGRAAEALSHCEEAIRLKPAMAEAHFNAGNACLALGRPDEALAHYQAAVRLQPDFAAALNNLGNLHLERDQVDQAMKCYAEAVRREVDYLEPRRSLALLLMHQGRPADALPHLEILAQALPDDPEIAQALSRARGLKPRRRFQ